MGLEYSLTTVSTSWDTATSVAALMVAMGITDGAAAPTPAPHAVLFPFSALGHVRPVLQLARRLAYVHGFKVTVVTTSHIYKRLGFAHAT